MTIDDQDLGVRDTENPLRPRSVTWPLEEAGFDIQFISHARPILELEFSDALQELADVLVALDLPISEIIGSGGGETRFTQRLRRSLSDLGWKKHEFVISKTIDGVARESTSHEVDHVRLVNGVGLIACEIEWNNKDPFFDRDLENFKRLHAEGAISVGILITRGGSLQDFLHAAVHRFAAERGICCEADLDANGIVPTPKQLRSIRLRVNRSKDPIPFVDAWVDNFVSNKYGQATTHWEKLQDRVRRGVGNPCPLLLVGLPSRIVSFDSAAVEALVEDDLVPVDGATD